MFADIFGSSWKYGETWCMNFSDLILVISYVIAFGG